MTFSRLNFQTRLDMFVPRRLWQWDKHLIEENGERKYKWGLWNLSLALGNTRDALNGQFIPIFAIFLWNNPWSVAVLSSMVGLASFFQLLFAWVNERYKHSRVTVIISDCVTSLSYFGMGVFPNIFVASGLRFSQGLAVSAANVNETALLAHNTSPMERPTRNAAFLWASRIGLLSGTFAGGFLLTFLLSLLLETGLTFSVIFIVSGAIGLVGALFFALSGVRDTVRPPLPEEIMIEQSLQGIPTTERFRALLTRNSTFVRFCVISFLFNCTVQVASPFFVVLQTTAYGLTPAEISVLTSMNLIVQIIIAMLFGRYLAQLGLKILIFFGAVIAGIFTLYFWLFSLFPVPLAFLILFPAWILGGIGWGLFHTAETTLLIDLAHPRHRPTSMALYHTMIAITVVVMPIIGAWIAQFVDLSPIFLISGVGRIITAFLFLIIAEPIIEGRLVLPMRVVGIRALRYSVERGIAPILYVSRRRKARSVV